MATGFLCSATQPVIPCPILQFQPVHHLRVRILGGAENQFVSFENVDEAGIALHDARHELDHQFQNGIQGIGGGDALADLVQDLNLVTFALLGVCVHTSTLGSLPRNMQIQIPMHAISIYN